MKEIVNLEHKYKLQIWCLSKLCLIRQFIYLITITNSCSVSSKCPFFDLSCIGKKTVFSIEKNADLGFLGIVQRMSELNFLSKNTPSRCFIPLMINNVSFFHDGFLAKLLIYFSIRFETFFCAKIIQAKFFTVRRVRRQRTNNKTCTFFNISFPSCSSCCIKALKMIKI